MKNSLKEEPEVLKGIFIDMDGTIVDSIPELFDVYRAFLASYGKEGSYSEFLSLPGPSFFEVVENLGKRHKIDYHPNELYEHYLKMSVEKYSDLELFPDTKEFLVYLKDQALDLILVTAALSDHAKVLIDSHQLEHLFDGVITSDHLKRCKPDPEVYHHALKEHSFCAQEVIAIEDSDHGAEAAVLAGISTVMITHGNLEKKAKHKDVQITHNWGEIQNIIEERV